MSCLILSEQVHQLIIFLESVMSSVVVGVCRKSQVSIHLDTETGFVPLQDIRTRYTE